MYIRYNTDMTLNLHHAPSALIKYYLKSTHLKWMTPISVCWKWTLLQHHIANLMSEKWRQNLHGIRQFPLAQKNSLGTMFVVNYISYTENERNAEEVIWTLNNAPPSDRLVQERLWCQIPKSAKKKINSAFSTEKWHIVQCSEAQPLKPWVIGNKVKPQHCQSALLGPWQRPCSRGTVSRTLTTAS